MERNSVENRLSELEKQYSRIEEKLDLIISIFEKDLALIVKNEWSYRFCGKCI